MELKKTYLQWTVYFVVALVLQLLFRDFPCDFFAFPVNAACILLGCVGLWILNREKPGSWLSGMLSAPESTYIVIGVFLVSCLALGLGLDRKETGSWWFVMTLLALLAVLLYTIYRGAFRHRVRVRFLLIHAGLLLALLGGFAGSADTDEWRVLVPSDVSVNEAYDAGGTRKMLRQSFRMENFIVEYYPDGVPRDFEAMLDVDGKKVAVKVNHPYSLSFSDEVYLVDYEHVPQGQQAGYCVLQIVHQPWKYLQWAGIWMMIGGAVLLFIRGIQLAGKDKKEAAK